jgi:hypothetical protein
VASLVERSIWNGGNELFTCGKVRQVVSDQWEENIYSSCCEWRLSNLRQIGP